MAKVSNELFLRLTWYRRYEEFRGRVLGVFRDVREMLLLMEAAGTFNHLPKDVFTAVIHAELDWLERLKSEPDPSAVAFPEGVDVAPSLGTWRENRENERSSYQVKRTSAELSHRATDYQSYMRETGDKSVLRDDKELIRVMEAAGTMKRLPAVVRNAFYQAELLWDRSSLDSPRVYQLEYSRYENPYLDDDERYEDGPIY